MIKHIKRIDNNCHIPDLIQAFSSWFLQSREAQKKLLVKSQNKSYSFRNHTVLTTNESEMI